MKIKEVCDNISRMTYSYINPDTKQPTIVPSKHYKDILDQPVEVLVNDQVKKQFLNIMFKQMKALKEEEFHLVDHEYIDSYEATKNDSELMASLFGDLQNERTYSIEIESKGGKKNDLQH